MSTNIVVGVDFGTTYTAVAWAQSSGPRRLEIVDNWPTSGEIVGAQVPSEIAYSQNDRTSFSWGYNISPRLRKIKWFKLSLEIGQDVLEYPFNLSAADVICDYLSAIRQHVLITLQRRLGANSIQRAKVAFTLTTPAIWSDAAKKITKDAAVRAGMGGDIQLLSEPECAALYSIKTLENLQSVHVQDRLVVCDAGGGTVDIITYEIVQMSPLKVRECTVGTGDYCGSTFIDREFEKLLIRRLGVHYENISPLDRQQIIKNFEYKKVAFRNQDDQSLFYINMPTIGTLEDVGIYRGVLEISQEEMRSLFDPIVSSIIDLLAAQVKAVSPPVNSILLVGGFGGSEYLYQCICNWSAKYEIGVFQPSEAATAVVRGAVMKGLEGVGPSTTEVTRRARRWYGVTITKPYVEGRDLVEDRIYNVETGQVLARNQISWFIKKVHRL
ncbi:MAG: hypothetical protein LQ351_003371 [Letrouitia transgressa]|nr:MAG: hypothetical protein LQ351_003371 [Letrouitia transgressa]